MPTALPADDLFEAFFDLSLMGGILFAPVMDAAGQVLDFTYVRLNPAARRMLALPAQPAASFLTRYPHALPTGIFAFYREAFVAGEARRAEFNYQHDGLDNYFHLAARRVGQQLLVSFTDTSEQPRTAVEQALRESQAREQAAHAEAMRRQELLRQLFEHSSMPLALLRGEGYVVELANPALAALWGRPLTEVVGRPVFEALPDLRGQGFEEILADVQRTGQPFTATEVPVVLDRAPTRQATQGYFNLTYRPLRDQPGSSSAGIVASAVEVTEQVLARQQVEQLNQELEARVQGRTQQLIEQQALLQQILGQVPAAIATFRGPDHRFTFFNADYQAIVAGRARLGATLLEAVPEVAAQGFVALLDEVYATQQPFVSRGAPARLLDPATGQLAEHYVDLSYQALRDEQGQSTGILVFVVDVTEGVLARRQADTLQAAMLGVAQRRLQQREELFQVFEQTPAAIALLRGPAHRFEYVNPAYQQLFPGQLLRGHRLAEAHPDTAASGVLARLDHVLATGETYWGQEQPVPLPAGPHQPPQLRYFNFTYQAYREQERIEGVSIVAYDVTEQVLVRAAATQALEQQRQELEVRVQARTQEAQTARAAAERERTQLQALLAQAPVAIALFQGESLVVAAANSMMATLWGCTPAQVVGRPLVEGVPELRGQGFDDLLRQVLTTRAPVSGTETPATLLRGGVAQTSYYNFVYQPLYDAEGEVLGVIDVAIDVTEQVLVRRQVEQLNQELEARVQARTQQLSEQQALLRQILGQVPAAIATFSGPGHRYTFFNELYQELTASRVALGLMVADLVPELLEQGFVALLDEVYATGNPYAGTDVPVKLLDASTGQLRQRYVDFIYQPLFDKQQQVQGILAFVLDVTDRALARRLAEQSQLQVQALNQELATINEELRATNEDLHASNAQLTRTNADLDTFVYTASHDLKAPITNIEGLLTALRDYLPGSSNRDSTPGSSETMIPYLLQLMDGAVARFLVTINQLSDVSRLQNAASEPAEPVALAELVENIRLDLTPLLANTRGQLLIAVDECPTVVFSPKNLRSLLYNLFSNALKYRSPDRDPVVRLQATCPPGLVMLEVQDNGLGLNEVQQSKLFTLFQRLHTHVEGSGVGLYMLKRIVENAKGTISVRSEPGVGTTFTVRLPRQAP